jgi:cytochrome c peroxidase
MRRLSFISFALALVLLGGCSSDGGGPGDGGTTPEVECPAATPLVVDTPPGFPDFEAQVPADNPTTVEGVALGRRLFYDPILSGDSTQACASCHLQSHAFGDTLRFSVGIDDIEGDRQAPTIINGAWLKNAFWDGRVTSLEDQAKEPVPNEIEMHLEWSDAVARLSAHPEYPEFFCAAFGDHTITMERVVKAIAQFERTFVSADSRYDRFVRGELQLTPKEEAGRQLFFTEVADCFHCHGQNLGFDRDFHDIGLDSVISDRGLGEVTDDPADDGKFKTPALRNVMVSAPYMHDGRFATIDEVLAHYNHGFHDSERVDPLIRARLTRPKLTPGQLDTLKTFLNTFTDETFLNNPDLSNPFTE